MNTDTACDLSYGVRVWVSLLLLFFVFFFAAVFGVIRTGDPTPLLRCGLCEPLAAV